MKLDSITPEPDALLEAWRTVRHAAMGVAGDGDGLIAAIMDVDAALREGGCGSVSEICECSGWQPIETAPKDGAESFLLTDGRVVTFGGWLTDVDHGAEYDGQFSGGDWLWIDDCDTPTHWMPLPPAPKERTEP